MNLAIISFITSIILGFISEYQFPGSGAVVAISIMGSIIIYKLDKKK